MKQLLEEAKRISGPGAQALYQTHLKPSDARSTKSAKSSTSAREASAEGHKSARKKGRPERGKSGAKSAGGMLFSPPVSALLSCGF